MITRSLSLLIVLALTLSFLPAQAQQKMSAEDQKRYLNGKTLLKEKKYSLAAETFKPLMKATDVNYLAPTATYYYALSTFNQKKYDQTRQALRQLTDKFPNWKNIEEAHYLAMLTAFEQSKTEGGFSVQ